MTTDAGINAIFKESPARLVHQIGNSASGTVGSIFIVGDVGIIDIWPMEDIWHSQVVRDPNIIADIDACGLGSFALTRFLEAAPAVGHMLGTNQLAVRGGFLDSTDGTFMANVLGPINRSNLVFERRDVGQLPKAVIERLQYLARLPQNWDLDGAASISSGTIARARAILQEAFAAEGHNLPVPSIAPAYDGMLVIEWNSAAGKELTIDIPANDDPSGFLLVEPQSEGEEIEIDEELGGKWSTTAVIHRLLEA